MILHSDRCSQFTSPAFRKVLAQYGAVQSMSGTGRCYGNARMESFFATLKKEKLYRIRTERMPMAQVKSIVFRYIMTYYNRQRIYTANPGGLPPRHVPSGRQRSGRISCRFWVFTFCTVLDFSKLTELRYGRASTVIAGQLPCDKWYDLFPAPTLADAILDRLVHNAYKFNITGESMRKTLAERQFEKGNGPG